MKEKQKHTINNNKKWIKIILILTLFIYQINTEYTINQFNELCSTKHSDQFEEKNYQFKNEYKKSCPTNY